jgi:hypothetical protein
MRAIVNVDTLQIHTTNACVLQCSGCTHLCGHHKKPYMMTLEEFKQVIDSLEGFPRMIGFIGGEPLLVPWFAEQARYARSKFPREQLGLWSVFPEGEKYARYREVICESFGNILLNDHSRGDIMHAPVLVASGEYFQKECADCRGKGVKISQGEMFIPDGMTSICQTCQGKGTVLSERDLYLAADACWVQNSWSPGITPKGGFFCEVAAELDQLFDGPGGWDVSEAEWWKRTPKDYAEQIERSCSKCGCCMPLARRSSQDEKCDMSEGNVRLLAGKSRKVDNGLIYIQKAGHFRFDEQLAQAPTLYPNQTYKQEQYRKGIAARYGIDLVMTPRGYWEPVLHDPNRKPPEPGPPSLFGMYQERYTEVTGPRAATTGD